MDHPYDLLKENFTIAGRSDNDLSTMPDLRYLNDDELMWHRALECLRTLRAYHSVEISTEPMSVGEWRSMCDRAKADHDCAVEVFEEAYPKTDWAELLGFTGYE